MIKLNFVEFIVIALIIWIIACTRVELMYFLKQYYNNFKEWLIQFIE